MSSADSVNCRIVRSKYGWYISFYSRNPVTGKMELHRRKGEMNRIKDLDQREHFAQILRSEIERKAVLGFPYKNVRLGIVRVKDAFETAYKIKCQTDRDRTISNYKSHRAIFFDFLAGKNLLQMDIRDFHRQHCHDFMDYVSEKRIIGPTTYNNYIKTMKAFWNEMIHRTLIMKNPWTEVNEKKEFRKKRRAFTEDEARIMLSYLKTFDYELFIIVLLIYYCFIRPEEIRYLRPQHFHFHHGYIALSCHFTKNKCDENVTIPKLISPILAQFMQNIPRLHLIFGAALKPHQSIQVGRNTMNHRHRAILHRLNKHEIIPDIEGLSLYSWKDTGAQNLVKSVDIQSARVQLRHKDLNTTQRYLENITTVNPSIRKYEDSLMEVMWNSPKFKEIK